MSTRARPTRGALVCAVALGALGSPCLALAQAPAATAPAPERAADTAAAEALFNEARRLEKEGDGAAACAKFEASYRVDPAPGTLLNVAECSRKAGKTATAWGQFLEAARQFRRRTDERRAAFADEKARELEPRLARVKIVATDAPGGLLVRRDGVELEAAALGTELPVDPGAHTLVVEAPGFEPAELGFEAIEGEVREVALPALTPSPEEPEPTRGAGSSRTGGTLRTVGLVVGGVGVASLVAGGVFVGLTAERTSAADERCPGQVCDAEGIAIVGEAETFANVANVTIIGGAALTAAGLALILFAPSDGDEATLSVAPWLGPGTGGVSLGGRF